MVFYHGVSKDEIIQSVQNAAAFILSLNIGPRNNEWASSFAAGADACKPIKAAQSPQELKDALMPFCAEISRCFYVLHAHAMMDTNSKGKDAYVALCRWRAFGNMSLHQSQADRERDEHLKRAASYLSPSYSMACARHILNSHRIKGDALDPKRFAVEPVHTFGIVMETGTRPVSGAEYASDPYQKQLRELDDLLQEDMNMRDVRHITVESFEVEKGKHIYCVGFISTHAVAEKVAAHFKDKQIITEKGELVVSPQSAGISDVAHDGTVSVASKTIKR